MISQGRKQSYLEHRALIRSTYPVSGVTYKEIDIENEKKRNQGDPILLDKAHKNKIYSTDF